MSEKLHPGECRLVSKDGAATLTMTVHDYGNEFRFVVGPSGEAHAHYVCPVSAEAALVLYNTLGGYFKSKPAVVSSTAADLTERLIRITAMIQEEPVSNRLAMASFIAGYFGYKIAP